jgi:predicted nucleotidyltransferase
MAGEAGMQISDEEMKIYRRSAHERMHRRQQELEARRERAWEIARQAAEALKKEFGASRVVLFGSLSQPQLFHLRSDVDLAAWNVQHYFRAVARLLDLDPEIEVNLVPIEDARPELRTVIERDGVEL